MLKIFFCLISLWALVRAQNKSLDHKLGQKIVNGENAKLGEFPYQVSLQRYSPDYDAFFHICGGSIINKYWILTAAHCLENKTPKDVKVLVGTINLKKPYKYYQATVFILHEKYENLETVVNDLALIKVDKPFQFSKIVKPVTLPKLHEKINVNSTAIISGWGADIDFYYPDDLQKATIYVADPDYCHNVLKEYDFYVNSTHLCANDPLKRVGHCSGDSGGPLTIGGVIYGIVSWAHTDSHCGSPAFPQVYTRVSEFVDWIVEHAK